MSKLSFGKKGLNKVMAVKGPKLFIIFADSRLLTLYSRLLHCSCNNGNN